MIGAKIKTIYITYLSFQLVDTEPVVQWLILNRIVIDKRGQGEQRLKIVTR